MRALLVDPDEQVLLCRFDLPDQAVVVWAAPGGGVEPGETDLAALRRELDEEVGVPLAHDPPLVWTQRVVDPRLAVGFDGVRNDFYLVRTDHVEPRGRLGAAALAAENIAELRWWTPTELGFYQGEAVFSPRDLPRLLATLLEGGAAPTPLQVGL